MELVNHRTGETVNWLSLASVKSYAESIAVVGCTLYVNRYWLSRSYSIAFREPHRLAGKCYGRFTLGYITDKEE